MRTAFETALRISHQALYVKQNYKCSKGFYPAYIRYRILRPVLKMYNRILKLNTDKAPWMSPAAIRIFKTIISKNMRGFEYGSGSSTIFFASLCNELVSIEHHEGWYGKVKQQLARKGLTNISYHIVKANTNGTEILNPGLEKQFSSINIMPEFASYFSFIDRYENAYFDFVIVDGRARPECVWYAIPKLKPGGFMVLDNAERKRYRPIHQLLKDWNKVFTSTGLTDTVFWFKPDEQGR